MTTQWSNFSPCKRFALQGESHHGTQGGRSWQLLVTKEAIASAYAAAGRLKVAFSATTFGGHHGMIWTPDAPDRVKPSPNGLYSLTDDRWNGRRYDVIRKAERLIAEMDRAT